MNCGRVPQPVFIFSWSGKVGEAKKVEYLVSPVSQSCDKIREKEKHSDKVQLGIRSGN